MGNGRMPCGKNKPGPPLREGGESSENLKNKLMGINQNQWIDQGGYKNYDGPETKSEAPTAKPQLCLLRENF
jgi:hypothetical protein